MSSNVNLVTRLIAMEKRLVERGIEAMPVTVEYCERHVAECFS